jgi:ribonuclease PH
MIFSPQQKFVYSSNQRRRRRRRRETIGKFIGRALRKVRDK